MTGIAAGASVDYEQAGTRITAAPADPKIAAALKQVSAERIRHLITALAGFYNRSTLSSMATDLPPGHGINAAADWIAAQFQEYSKACGGCLEVKRDTFMAEPGPRIKEPTKLTNVYAVLRGSDLRQASRMYLVTGHYDSRNTDVMDIHGFAPGANDDASGVAVSLESARVLSKLKLPATLVFVAVAGEEQGLVGSRHLAQLAKQEGWQLEGVLNNDIVGGNATPGEKMQDKSTVRVFSEGVPPNATPTQLREIETIGAENDSPSRQLAREVAEVAQTYFSGNSQFHPTLEFRPDRFHRGGDHGSFNRQGFAAIRFTEWREDFDRQHQNVRTENGIEYGDLLKFVDFDYVARVARLNAATLATMAAAPGEPKNVVIENQQLENTSTLQWRSPEGTPEDTIYEIVWRPTAAPDWEFFANAKTFGDDGATPAHKVTIPISKDNVIFGVRSVDGAGHRSAVVAALPDATPIGGK